MPLKTINDKIQRTVFLVFFLISAFLLSAQPSRVDSLLVELETVETDLLKVPLLLDIATAYESFDNEQALTYSNQALSIAQSIGNSTLVIKSLRRIGLEHSSQEQYELGLNYIDQALKIAEETGQESLVCTLLNSKGSVYAFKEEDEKALSLYLRALKMAEGLNDSTLIVSIANNVGTIYNMIGDDEQSLKYFMKSIEVNRKVKNYEDLIKNLNNVGIVYFFKGDYDRSLKYYKEALQLAKKLNHVELIASMLQNIGGLYLKMKKTELAAEYARESLEISEKLNDDYGLAGGYALLGEISYAENRYAVSNTYFLKSLEKTESLKMLSTKQEIYEKLALNHIKLGNYEKATEAQQLLLTVKDSIFNKEKNQQILELKTKYETGLKEKENLMLRKQQALNQDIIKQRTTLGIASFFILLLISALAYTLFRANKQRKKSNKELEMKVNLLQKNLEAKKIIEEQSKKLQLVEQNKNRLFTNIAHEFQTPLNIIQGLCKQIARSEKLSSDENNALQMVIKNSNSLSEATNDILSISNAQQSDLSTKFHLFLLSDFLHYILPPYEFLAKEKGIDIVLSVDAKTNIYSDVDKLQTIFKNLLSNAVKFTDPEGTITITYSSGKKGFHQFLVKDNGRGIRPSELPQLFDRYYQSESVDTEGGFGLGLAICQEYITSLDGSIGVESELGIGSIFSVLLPKVESPSEVALFKFPEVKKPQAIDLIQSPQNTERQTELLIVEDNKDFCKYLEILLKDDYHIQFVHDGQQAINFLASNTPALIITDWMMAGMDGLSLVQELKASYKFQAIPLLMLTARSLTSDKIKALRAGVDDYLIKPFDEDILKTRIRHLLELELEEYHTPSFSTIQVANQEFALSDQDWLIELEENIRPLIGNFDLHLDQVTTLMNTNLKSLNERIKTLTGLTTKKYIQEIRYWEARRMLETGVYDSVKAVCLSVGFKDRKNFSRKFRERFGAYPSDYLKK